MGAMMKSFFAGFFLALTLLACAATPTFNYKFYHVTPAAVWQTPAAKLLGEKPQDDRALTECAPVPGTDPNGKPIVDQRCVVMFYDELRALVTDYKDTKQKLIDCQRGQ